MSNNLGRLREGLLRNGNIKHKMKVESGVSLMANFIFRWYHYEPFSSKTNKIGQMIFFTPFLNIFNDYIVSPLYISIACQSTWSNLGSLEFFKRWESLQNYFLNCNKYYHNHTLSFK
jgi:hypothetical protein